MQQSLKDHVVLVDSNDREIGTMEKMEAHERGLLHRAFSVFVFNSTGQLLMQQRAHTKYHSGGLWTNTCCSHPRQGEAVADAAQRRLMEEMGLEVELMRKFHFTYKAPVGNGLWEHELDHVFFGHTDKQPYINASEAAAWKYMTLAEIEADMRHQPQAYTAWFRIVFERVLAEM